MTYEGLIEQSIICKLIICKGQILKVPSQIILELHKREQEFEEVNKTTTDCQFVLLFNKSKTITSLRLNY